MHIDQVVVAAAPGDAISNEALEIRRLLRGSGRPSQIYARYIDPGLAGSVLPLTSYPAPAGAEDRVLVYHASIGEPEVTRFLLERPERLVLRYHNMSPAEPFAPYDPGFAGRLEEGRRELEALRSRVQLCMAVSAFNAADLVAHGYGDVGVSPLIVDPGRLVGLRPDEETTARLAGTEGPVLAFVGQLLPHKQVHVLLAAYHALTTYLLPDAHLFLVGAPRLPRYRECLQFFIEDLNLVHCQIPKPPVSDAQLAAYYRRADAVVTLSGHEGFCAPLLEAMAFGKPVVARAAGAIPETVADAGLLVAEDEGPLVVAEALDEVLTNAPLRARLVERGAGRVEHFRPERARTVLLEQLARLESRP